MKTGQAILWLPPIMGIVFGTGVLTEDSRSIIDIEKDNINWTRLVEHWPIYADNRVEYFCFIAPITVSANIHKLEGTNVTRVIREAGIPGWSILLHNLVDTVMGLLKMGDFQNEIDLSVMSKSSCDGCKLGLGYLQSLIKHNVTDMEILIGIYNLCVSLKFQHSDVCFGFTTSVMTEFLYVMRRVELTPSAICSFVVGGYNCVEFDNPLHDWSVTIPPKAKTVNASEFGTSKLASEEKTTFTILHLSDLHYDPLYVEGSNAECGKPLCCHETDESVKNSTKAGRWGDYRKCDTPRETLYHMLKHIQKQHVDTESDIAYIILTGDLPPHDIWNQTRARNLKILRDTTRMVAEAFPDIRILPALGNHESAPINSFAPPFAPDMYKMDWLFKDVEVVWNRMIFEKLDHIREGAFYAVDVYDWLRVISINTNYCNNKNFWLLIDSEDPLRELNWLVDTLQDAETKGMKVHIIGHIPIGGADCLRIWAKNYYKIISRYASTVTAQFFGHTHLDEFEVFYDEKDLKRAIGIAYIAPSVTPYTHLNPGYRTYIVNDLGSSSPGVVVDHTTWIMDLEKANRENNVTWHVEYSAREAYGMPSLEPKEWDALIDRLAKNDTLFELFFKHHYKDSPMRPQCNAKCRERILCDLRCGSNHLRRVLCRHLDGPLKETRRKEVPGWLLNFVDDTKQVFQKLWDFVKGLWTKPAPK